MVPPVCCNGSEYAHDHCYVVICCTVCTLGMHRSYGASEPGETSRINQLRGQVDEVRTYNPLPPTPSMGVAVFQCLCYTNLRMIEGCCLHYSTIQEVHVCVRVYVLVYVVCVCVLRLLLVGVYTMPSVLPRKHSNYW